jgi:putative SOS response-associated peptidase YedK
MCNLYSYTRAQAEAIATARALRDLAGNLPPLPAIFPDNFAPVVRTGADGVRELVRLRWGMPTPPSVASSPDRGVTNIRNTASPHWRRWFTPEYRCVVPATSFCEPTDAPNPVTKKKDWVWFAFGPERPVFFFAGIWAKWTGARGTKANPVNGEHELFGFLTTEPNVDVRPVHSKAMPVILRTPGEIETWMSAPATEALKLQRPLPDGALTIARRGAEKSDDAAHT